MGSMQVNVFAETLDIYGVYESKLHYGDSANLSLKIRKARDKSYMTITINKDKIIFSIGRSEPDYFEMEYEVKGDFILAGSENPELEMYYPIYIKDKNTIFTSGRRFVKK
jgi:hypothetical protein